MTNRIEKLLTQVPAYCTTDPVEIDYLIGIKLSKGTLFAQKGKTALFVDGRYLEIAQQQASIQVALFDAMHTYLTDCPKVSVTMNGDRMTHTEYVRMTQTLQKAGFTDTKSKDPLKYLRLIKDTEEQDKIRQSARENQHAFNTLQQALTPGMTELDAVWIYEKTIRERGGYLSFDPIVAFGENGAYPHHHSGTTKLKENDTVLIDAGVTKDNYTSDCTRTIPYGTPDPKFIEIKEMVLEAKNRALKLCRPGTKVQDLDKAARDYFKEKGVSEYYVHALGHSLGIEVHEFPSLSERLQEDLTLEPGMCITIEPGLYYPGVLGVRAEDTIIITGDGHENLYPEDRIRTR